MQYLINGEAPFQVLTGAFTIGPSAQGYTLQISADGTNYSNLFAVSPNTTRMVTGVASGSFYRMLGNDSEVTVNWVRSCNTGGGGGGGTTYTAGDYISLDQDVISVTGITPDLYLTTADTQDFATQADITAATSPIQEHLDDVEYVTATALTELHDAIVELSGATGDYATEAYVTAATANLMTSAATQGMIEEATSGITEDLNDVIDMMQVKEQVIAAALVDLDEKKVESQDVHTIVRLTQAEYNLIATPDPETLYIIINQ